MPSRVWQYAATLVLLATHQVDAAFWREWDVFGVPGGLEFFLVFNVFAMAVLTVGLVHVAQGRRFERVFVGLCAATGFVTLALHAVFLVRDRVAFWAAPSLMLFAAIAVVSGALVARGSRPAPSQAAAPGSR